MCALKCGFLCPFCSTVVERLELYEWVKMRYDLSVKDGFVEYDERTGVDSYPEFVYFPCCNRIHDDINVDRLAVCYVDVGVRIFTKFSAEYFDFNAGFYVIRMGV